MLGEVRVAVGGEADIIGVDLSQRGVLEGLREMGVAG